MIVFALLHAERKPDADDLSRRHAEAAAAELVKNFRIAQARLRTAGRGIPRARGLECQ